jgi:uncharacterized OB-fold protein
MTLDTIGAPWIRDDGAIKLVYKSCLDCGREDFPAQPYGCLKCGAHAHEVYVDRLADAVGTLVAQVEVNINPGHPTPYRIGEIAVDATTLRVQALLTDDASPGARVTAFVMDEGSIAFAPREETTQS